ncbi:CAP domain-containing protein [Halteromyces radiatus]|uniref:CAP domain-containing protein n=1 Tax=Halteromyces radiatus TaxID=101107 RepID=UPI00221E4F2E|nr:CAP domain-containing protein [Halteromyces radiatus]KAI8084979.1 CAP domain-containing protein [Halteromyces radiatus]
MAYGGLIPHHDNNYPVDQSSGKNDDTSITPYEGYNWEDTRYIHDQGQSNDQDDTGTSIGDPHRQDDKGNLWPWNGVDKSHILQLHNTRRAKHRVSDLTWNQDAANFADSWVKRCSFQHSQNHKYGENIAWGYFTWDQVMKAWADDEEPKYNFQHGDFSEATGHFTQVVWKSTTSVGCAVNHCLGIPFYSCNYVPPGNVVGQFQQNVFPPK